MGLRATPLSPKMSLSPTAKQTGQKFGCQLIPQFRIFIVSADKICEQCLQTASPLNTAAQLGSGAKISGCEKFRHTASACYDTTRQSSGCNGGSNSPLSPGSTASLRWNYWNTVSVVVSCLECIKIIHILRSN